MRDEIAAAAKRSLELRGLRLEQVVGLHEAAQLTSLSIDTLKRRYPDFIIRLSPRRLGIKLRDVLAIGGK
jgi:hypothetical protein